MNDLGFKLPTAKQVLRRAMIGGGRKAAQRVPLRVCVGEVGVADLGLCECGRPVKHILVASHRTEDQHAVTFVHEEPHDDGGEPWQGTALNIAFEIAEKRSCSALVGKRGLVTAHAIHTLWGVIEERVKAYRVKVAVEGST